MGAVKVHSSLPAKICQFSVVFDFAVCGVQYDLSVKYFRVNDICKQYLSGKAAPLDENCQRLGLILSLVFICRISSLFLLRWNLGFFLFIILL